MKILLSTGIFPNKTNINRGIYIFNQAKALARHCELIVVAPIPYFPRLVKSKRYSSFSMVPRHDVISGIRITYPRYFVTPKVLRSLHGYFLLASVFFAYRRKIIKHRPDLILGFHAYPYGFASVVIAKICRLPVIIGCRGSDINYLTKHYWRKKIIRWTLRNCEKVLAVSDALRMEIIKLAIEEDQVVTIPNGIELDLFSPIDKSEARHKIGIEPEDSVSIYIGRLNREKGVDVLIQALKFISRSPLKLFIIGSGPEESRLKSMAKRLGLRENIVFVGEKPYNEIPIWINASDLLVLPSRSEGYPNILIEAIACGVPVVATRVGGVPEIITSDELGFLADPDDPYELSKAIEKALYKKWDARKISSMAAGRSWDMVAKDILHEADRILEESLQGTLSSRSNSGV